MVSPINPIQVPSLDPSNRLEGLDRAGSAGAAGRAGGAPESPTTGFGDAIGNALSEVGRRENEVQRAAEAAAVGDLRSVSDYMIAATEAQLATEITVAVRDRAINAFNDIMRMQI